jgi:anti-sigma factor ChrR (cupin superfamily)
MELNANFNERVAVHNRTNPWIASPMGGVERRMLDRIGDEVARATTIVRFAPGSHFSPHTHDGGEEFLVLDGVFQDEHGDFPAGSYIRNPPTTSHTPGSEAGCTIFVKLWQFDMADRTEVFHRPENETFTAKAGIEGVEEFLLHQDVRETVTMERWAAGVTIELIAPHGLEVLVLEGSFTEEDERFEKHSWLRLPKAGSASIQVGEQGAKVWIKRDYLALNPKAPNT